MARLCWFLTFFHVCSPLAAQENQPQPEQGTVRSFETLPFYLKQYPIGGKTGLVKEPLRWKILPQGVNVHISRLGTMHGRTLHAVRYLPGTNSVKAREPATALMILAGKRGASDRLEPIYFLEGEGSKLFEDFTVSPVMEQRGQPFAVLRTHVSDVGRSSVFRTCLTINPSSGNFQLTSLGITPEDLVVYLKQGWDLTREGNMGDFDEKNLSMTIPLARIETRTGKRMGAVLIYEWRFIGGELKRKGPAEGFDK